MMSVDEMRSVERELARMIDHTLLSATAGEDDIRRLCEEAKQWGFWSVCVNPRWVAAAADIVHGSGVKVCSVAGFPLGANTAKVKVAEAQRAIMDGADEVDMVVDLAAVKARDENYLSRELVGVLRVCREMRPAVLLKVIIESAALERDEKVFICELCSKHHVDFIKTSTGLHPAGGASVEDVKLLREFGAGCKVKASGGIRTLADAHAMIEAGADRLGCSASVKIMGEFRANRREVQD